MKGKKKTLLIIVMLVIIGGAGTGYYLWHSKNTASTTNKTQQIQVVAAKAGSVSVVVEGPAIVEPVLESSIRSKISGIILKAPLEGDRFKKGETIILFDRSDLQKLLEQTSIKLSQAKVNRDKAKQSLIKLTRDLENKKKLLASGAVSREEVNTLEESVSTAKYNLKLAELSVKEAELAYQDAKDNLKAANITAPFDGVVLKVNVKDGDLVNSGALLANYGNLSRVRLVAEIDEFDIGKVKPGQPVTITSDTLGKTTLHSKVERISPQAEIVNNISIFKVSTVVNNIDGALKPGMSADISILIRSDRGIVVPSRAVSTVRTRSYIKIYEEGKVKTKRIKVGADNGMNVVVLEGLKEGEKVVLPGGSSLTVSPSTTSNSSSSSIIPINVPGTGGMK